MTSARRLWVYGLLLLLSALGVGAIALGLLARVHGRLTSRVQSARDARAAAVADRTRIIAENIELLVGDVQNALMTTLGEAPTDEPRPFLTEWQTYNPLVRDVFRTSSSGAPLWGASTPASRAWLATVPWRDETVPALAKEVASQEERKKADARGDISANVFNYQTVRRSLEAVAKVQSEESAVKAQEFVVSQNAQLGGKDRLDHNFGLNTAPMENDAVAGRAARSVRPLNEAPATEPPAVLRTGWAWFDAADGPHRFGWRELADGTVIGFELRLEMIKARLADVFPSKLEAGEAYVLQDADNESWHGAATGSAAPLLTVPLAGTVLPGWTVAGYLDEPATASLTDGGLVAAGATLVALLVGAILSSGALLIWQARRSEAEAAQKTSFVANVSHEFKTPLTTIRLYSELLAQGRVRDETKRDDYLRTIGSETQRLARLVNNVLDFSRLEQGLKKFDLHSLDVAAELRGLLDTHAPRLAESGLTLTADIPAETCTLTCDRDAFQQIVLNLLDNACKYAASGCEVHVSLACDPVSGATLRVADRGPGVPAGQRERIFEKFHRLDDRLTAAHGGTGLGLSIARQLARGLGGDLKCLERAGGGAEFVLTLPVSRP